MAFRRWLVFLVLVNGLARVPLCWDPANVAPDGAEYLAIARSLWNTHRYRTDLKWQFYTDEPVRHDALADRPPLYPAFAALCRAVLSALEPPAAARLGNAALACAALVLAALYLRRLFGPVPALLATGFVFLLPHTLFWTTQPTTEAISLLLSLGALLLWSSAATQASGPASASGSRFRRTAAGLAAGGLAGLLYLARPSGALLLLALSLDSLLLRRRGPAEDAVSGPDSGRSPPPLPALLAGFLLFALPYHLALWWKHGSPLHSALGFTFAVTSVLDVTVFGFERAHPGALEFLAAHAVEIPGLVLRQASRHAQGVILPILGLLPFAFALRRSGWSGPRRPAALLVLVTLLFHTAAWSARGSSRYFLLCLLLLAGVLLHAGLDGGLQDKPLFVRTGKTRACLLAVTALGLCVFLVRFYGEQLRPDRGIAAVLEWRSAAERVRGASLVASDNPWILNLLAETPAVMLPRTTDAVRLERFVTRYGPEFMVLFAGAGEGAAMARAWRSGGLPAGWNLDRDAGGVLIASWSGARAP